MESMVSIVNFILGDVSSERVLKGQIDYERFPYKEFVSLYNHKSDAMSGNDVDQLFYYVLNLLGGARNGEENFSVLDLIKVYVNRILKQVRGEPVCKYQRLLAWRMVTSKLEEDIFTTAFLALQDMDQAWKKREDFNWATVIGHDNYELNNLLKKGVVENHYHLKGSGPYFALTWQNLMNHVGNRKFTAYLDQFENNKLSEKIGNEKNTSYMAMHLQAAMIRAFLLSRLENSRFSIFESYEMSIKETEKYLNWPEMEENVKEAYTRAYENFEKRGQKKVGFGEFLDAVLIEAEKEQKIFNGSDRAFWMALTGCISRQKLFELSYFQKWKQLDSISLKKIVMLFFEQIQILHIPDMQLEQLIRQEFLGKFVREKEFEKVCYYLRDPEIIYEIRQELNAFIDGSSFCRSFQCGNTFLNANHEERKFLYTMFLHLYEKDPQMCVYGNLFYAYLLIKGKIRSELVQVNNKTGFKNFLEYQNRKEYFIDHTSYETIYSYMALADTWHYQKDTLDRLEARISPKNNAAGDKKAIQGYLNALQKIEEGKERTFFVFHFVKEPDRELVSGKQQCRHFRKRVEVRRKAIAIECFRQRYPQEASAVYGIDACSPEIGCRPEVFAQAFTYLRGMQGAADVHAEKVPRLGITYHVGEDFLDIVDGLRAIDEAIHFLQMDSGDRLGHALALGVTPKEWYEFKGKRVLMTKQDHLDNIVWMYMKIRKYNIRHSESMLQNLYRDYLHCVREIYGTEYDINIYYDTWKLRGDDPEMYLVDNLELQDTEWNRFAKNSCYPENSKIREQEICRDLYITYHYDENVKIKGAEVVECKVKREWIEVVEQIQQHLQREVAGMGISIEVNPSSNYMIGTFRRYDQHPIRNFYNKGLTTDSEEIEKCPQIDVTINTDDQAVFSTKLENEYAYIALSMEKLRRDSGEPVYKRSMIYEWLNNIRKNGKKVCFFQNK